MIVINGQNFDNNPCGICPALIFKANIYKRDVIVGPNYEVYGTSESEVEQLARQAAALDGRVDTAMIWGPTNYGSDRQPVRLIVIR